MPGGPIPEHIKAAAVASVRAGMTIRAAAARHGVPYASVGRWSREASQRGDTPGATKVVVEPNRAGPEKEASPPARANIPVVDMSPALKRASRLAVAHRLAFLAKPESMHHKDAKSIALQLRLIVEATPEALTLAADEKSEHAEMVDAVSARVRATIARRHAAPEPTPLTAIDGGKRETG